MSAASNVQHLQQDVQTLKSSGSIVFGQTEDNHHHAYVISLDGRPELVDSLVFKRDLGLLLHTEASMTMPNRVDFLVLASRKGP